MYVCAHVDHAIFSNTTSVGKSLHFLMECVVMSHSSPLSSFLIVHSRPTDTN